MDRLKKWSAIAVAVFALAVGWSYFDIHSAITAGKGDISSAVQGAKADVAAVRKQADDLKPEIASVQSDIDQYRDTNKKIAKLQTDLTRVQRQVVDLGKRDLKANSIEITGSGPSHFSFGTLDCPASVSKGMLEDLCVKPSPDTLYQLKTLGELRPVASRSPIGFQDASTSAKPRFDRATRGTLFVEKGGTGKADAPCLCRKASGEQYTWLALGTR